MSDAFNSMADELRDIWSTTADFLPRILFALAILWALRWAAETLASLVDQPGIQAFFDRLGLGGKSEGARASTLFGGTLYGLVMLTAVRIATAVLDIPVLTKLIGNVLDFVPVLIAVVAMIATAVFFGNYIAKLIGPWLAERNITWLPTAIRWTFTVLAVVSALSFIRDTSSALDSAIQVLAASAAGVVVALMIALSIALGVGGIDTARHRLSARFSPMRTSPPEEHPEVAV